MQNIQSAGNDSNQTAHMHRLVLGFAGRINYMSIVGNTVYVAAHLFCTISRISEDNLLKSARLDIEGSLIWATLEALSMTKALDPLLSTGSTQETFQHD